jgi:hypothetical protein
MMVMTIRSSTIVKPLCLPGRARAFSRAGPVDELLKIVSVLLECRSKAGSPAEGLPFAPAGLRSVATKDKGAPSVSAERTGQIDLVFEPAQISSNLSIPQYFE